MLMNVSLLFVCHAVWDFADASVQCGSDPSRVSPAFREDADKRARHDVWLGEDEGSGGDGYDDDDNVCPDRNTCCPLTNRDHGKYAQRASSFSSSLSPTWGCVPYNKHLGDGPGVCCGSRTHHRASTERRQQQQHEEGKERESLPRTGCPPGYRCASAASTAAFANDDDDDDYANVQDSLTFDRDAFRYRHQNDDNGNGPPSDRCEREKGTPAEGRPDVLPRYVLCSLPKKALTIARGFPVTNLPSQDRNRNRTPTQRRIANDGNSAAFTTITTAENATRMLPPPELAYYSSSGRSVLAGSTNESDSDADNDRIRCVVIIVHGSDGNADDYLCSVSASVVVANATEWLSPMPHFDPKTEVLFLAPRFLVPEDGPQEMWEPTVEGAEPLIWNDRYPIEHTWRYGADSINVPLSTFESRAKTETKVESERTLKEDEGEGEGEVWGISSFEAMDRLVEHFVMSSERGQGRGEKYIYPNLERVVVVGHSAGGQFAQRWALTSISPAWGDIIDPTNVDPTEPTFVRNATNTVAPRTVHVAAVAANPRSYAYPDPRRFLPNGSFDVPCPEAIKACPGYDKWEWGLEPGGPIVAPYKDRSVQSVGGNVETLLRRFAERDVAYLSGTEDVLPLRGSCEDDNFQGPNRLERGRRYFSAMEEYCRELGIVLTHRRWEVAGVPHDHALMFQSPEGIMALFGGSG